MRALKAIALVLSICSLYAWLIFIAGTFTGAGHGTYFFFYAIVAPFHGSGLFAAVGAYGLWPVVSILLALRRFPAFRIAAVIALTAHYLGILVLISRPGWNDGIGKAWEYFPGTVTAFVAAYFLSQIFMWTLIVRKKSAG